MTGSWRALGDVNVVALEGSGTDSSARVRDRGSVRCMGRIQLWLYMGFGSDVSSTVRLNYSVTLIHE